MTTFLDGIPTARIRVLLGRMRCIRFPGNLMSSYSIRTVFEAIELATVRNLNATHGRLRLRPLT